MSVDGRDESLGDGGAEAGGSPSRQVPSQGGPSGITPEPSGPSDAPGTSGAPRDASVPAQRDRFDRRDGVLPPPIEPPPSDADLIGRMRAGDDTAYEELYRRHAEAVRRYARTCCRDAHTADDLTAEVFARMLQAVRRGHGPQHAVRAYLLTTVRRVAASWTKSAKREQLVDDFALFAAQSSRTSEVSDEETLDLGADVRAMHEAEQSMAMQAFRSLPERWQAVLWHTEVEDESPSEVATLFGLDANGTRVLASRAREGLKQAYLQAHVSATLTMDEECARYADRLGAYARGGLRTRAERGLRKHLEECAKCRLAAGQIKEVAGGIPAVVPVAVIGWFGAAGYAKAVALIAGGAGAGAAGAAGAAAATSGGSGGTAGGTAGAAGAAGSGSGGAGAGGGAAASEGLGATVKAGIAAGFVAVAAAAVALALVGNGSPAQKPEAKPPATSPVVEAPQPQPRPTPTPTPSRKPAPGAPVVASAPKPSPTPTPRPAPKPTPKPSPTPAPTPAKPTPTSTPAPAPTPTPTPPPPPAPVVYQWNELKYDVTGDHTKPEMRLGESSWVWRRWGVSIAGQRYTHGVTVHGESSVTIDLNRSCSAYDALVGVDDLTLGLGQVSFSVYADGALLWQSPLVKGGEPAIPVHVNLTGRKTVRLAVEPHTRFDAVALADWAESKFQCQ
ncbi:sigma-70 family RNA polymerase sigma factor [Streptomyces sp. WAC00263]|uniref:sigma-70 family RNA polymerase sigma factor n=1 Tax=Streptomyces sp. WAC00263 TaxID=1917422 RepID=UPI0015EE9BCF|nr:sigma-70 family RNA polymerase sigma factor [Streptomyces sp. WAC00263]KAF5996305.1 RNA polymerase subunit sigma-24 [Streptomyces sp. WAC00263]